MLKVAACPLATGSPPANMGGWYEGEKVLPGLSVIVPVFGFETMLIVAEQPPMPLRKPLTFNVGIDATAPGEKVWPAMLRPPLAAIVVRWPFSASVLVPPVVSLPPPLRRTVA